MHVFGNLEKNPESQTRTQYLKFTTRQNFIKFLTTFI